MGLTWWGANAVGSLFGCGDYYNPYYAEASSGATGFDYSEPVVTVPVEVPAPAADQPAPALPPGVSQDGLDKFDQARAAFL